MNINQIRKFAYKKIWKEGKTHQEVFDAVLEESKESPEEIAIMICRIPSPKKNAEKKVLWIIATILFFAMGALRAYALAVSPSDALSDLGYVIPTALFGVVIPIAAIYGASKAQMMAFGWTGIAALTTLILLYAQTQYVSDIVVHITAATTVLVMVAAGAVPRMMGMKFNKTIESKEVDGKIKKRQVFTFPE